MLLTGKLSGFGVGVRTAVQINKLIIIFADKRF